VAVHDNPHHPRLRHEAGITLLRHGTLADTRAFFESIGQLDSEDEFTKFYFEISEKFDDWKTSLASSTASPTGSSAPYFIVCPVWGATFARDFVELYCASLLAPDNLPALAQRRLVHFVVFCPADIEEILRKEPRFQPILRYANVHFVTYPSQLTNYSSRIDEHYGKDLGQYYKRSCKFLLMSTAHYVALGAARAVDGYVVPLGADVLLSDGSLAEIARIMEAGTDVVLVTGIRLGEEVRDILEERYRHDDGSLRISSSQTAELYVHHMPESFFVDSRHFVSMPIYLCWKVNETGVLVHSTHYHPTCIRAAATSHAYGITIDPVDSRFIDRAGFEPDRLHFVQDCSISVFGVEAEPLMGHDSKSANLMTPKDVGLWLSAFWSDLRAIYLRLPVRFSTSAPTHAWHKAEVDALDTVEKIVSVAANLEDHNRPYKSWQFARSGGQQNGASSKRQE